MAKGFHKHSLQGLPSVTAAANEIYKLQDSKALTKLLQLHGNHDTASNLVEETD
jgi:hypothetical protein